MELNIFMTDHKGTWELSNYLDNLFYTQYDNDIIYYDSCTDLIVSLPKIHHGATFLKDFIIRTCQNMRESWLSTYQPTDRDYVVSVIPTLKCNFACDYCFSIPDQSSAELNNAWAMSNIERLIERKTVENIMLTFVGGGEPTQNMAGMRELYNNVSKILSDRDIRLKTGICTNLSSEHADTLWIANTFDSITVSIDGFGDNFFVNRHPKDTTSWSKLYRNLKLILSLHDDVVIRFTVTKDNIQSIGAAVKFLTSMNGRKFSILPVVPIGNNASGEFQVQNNEYVRECIKIYSEFDSPDLSFSFHGLSKSKYPSKTPCLAVSTRNLVLHPTKKIFSCHRALASNTVDEAHFLVNDEFGSSLSQKTLKICNHCICKNSCLGGCSHLRLHTTSDNKNLTHNTFLEDCKMKRFTRSSFIISEYKKRSSHTESSVFNLFDENTRLLHHQ
jgi:radical SAM protein with 4Fe4S-binding SPASM domain